MGQRVVLPLICAIVIWGVSSAFTGAPLLTLPLALLSFVLVSQIVSQQASMRFHREQDEVVPILESVLPKIEAGLPILAAFRSAAAESRTLSSSRIGDLCFRMEQGTAELATRGGQGPVLVTLYAMLEAAARQGGEVTHPFRALLQMLASDQRLRRKQQLATIQIRWQANVLILIAGGILFASGLSHQEALMFLIEEPEGRILVIVSATLFALGQIILNIITARIADA